MRLLAAADIHIGRRSADLPPSEAAAVSSAAAFCQLADEAIRLEVQAVLLVGDVLDAANRFYEASTALDRGLQRLRRHRIWTYAVAGNHDAALLPEIARMNELRPEPERNLLRVLGQGGTWEALELPFGGGQLTLVGWSFPSSEHRASPLESFPHSLRPRGPALGLLHGDRDAAAGTPYAPFPEAALRETGIARWILGHIHKPDPADRPLSLYAGSLQGMDAGLGECGLHGPLLISGDPQGAFRVERLACMPLRYEQAELDLGEMPDATSLRQSLNDAVSQLVAGLEGGAALREVVLRPRLRCNSRSAPHDLLQHVEELWSGRAPLSCGQRRAWLSSPVLEVRPPVSLEQLAGQADFCGALARLILELDHPARRTPATLRLLEKVADEAARLDRQAHGASDLDPERAEDPTCEPPEAVLRRQAWLLLGALLEQTNGEPVEARR